MPETGVRSLLTEGLDELGLRASPDQVEALACLVDQVVAWAARINLTGHKTPELAARHLVLEAAALLAHSPPFTSLADLGSGAGFPGLPIAILRPDVHVALIESREKRHHFQREIQRRLRLGNAEPLRGRAEELEPAPKDAAVARAMARPGRALVWMRPWVRSSGWLLLPCASPTPRIEAPDGIEAVEVRSYREPCGGVERTLWIGRRLASAEGARSEP
jgi:16S rRNA (guanine527-N7)-methyltransferase